MCDKSGKHTVLHVRFSVAAAACASVIDAKTMVQQPLISGLSLEVGSWLGDWPLQVCQQSHTDEINKRRHFRRAWRRTRGGRHVRKPYTAEWKNLTARERFVHDVLSAFLPVPFDH
jgi:hypothetical protein